jgi:hypothetical protein
MKRKSGARCTIRRSNFRMLRKLLAGRMNFGFAARLLRLRKIFRPKYFDAAGVNDRLAEQEIFQSAVAHVAECVHAHRCARVIIMRPADDLPDDAQIILRESEFSEFVQSRCEKYSCSVFRKIVVDCTPSRFPMRGASRSSRVSDAGCDGRKASSDVRCNADGKGVWAWRPSGRC